MSFSVRFFREQQGLPYYQALEESGLAIDAIKGLSIRPRPAVLTLSNEGEYERLLTSGFRFEQQFVQVTPEERRSTISVHIFVDAGVEDDDLKRHLATYGTVVGPIVHKHDLYKGHKIDAGVRYVNMVLTKRI